MFAGDRSREYKNNSAFVIDGIDYARVIATRVYDVSLKNTLREIIRFILFDYDFNYNNNGENILVEYSYRGKNRKDYDEIVDRFGEIIKNHDSLEFIYKISVKCLIKKMANFVLAICKLKKGKVKNAFYAAILMSQFMHYKKKIEKCLNIKDYKLLVSFCDAHGIENLLTQIAKDSNVLTATLQHGQYRMLKRETENENVEVYENFISDYLFAWGMKTREEFVKGGIESNRIKLVGALKPFSNNSKMKPHEVKNVFGVVLDGNINHESNLLMIDYANYLAEKHSLKFVLRMHPKNNPNNYIPKCKSQYLLKTITGIENYEYANLVDFSLVHMTGVFVELLSVNSPMLLMHDNYLEEIFMLKDSTFSSRQMLDERYEFLIHNIKEFADMQYLEYRKFNEEGDIETNYKYAVEEILNT